MSFQKLLQMLKSLFFTEKQQDNKKKSSLQTLVILLVIGVGLMVFSHFYGGSSSKEKTTQNKAVTTSAQDAGKEIETFKNSEKKTFSSFEEYASYYEENLKDILNQVMGVSNVHVFVAVDSTVQNVYGKNSDIQDNRINEEDENGGTRVTNEESKKDDVVIIDGGDGGKEPLVVTQKSPIVKGVWIVAYGVDNPTVKSWIVESVSSVLGIPSYKVSVTQAKSKEE